MGQIVAKARGDECVQCLHENEVHTIKKKAATTGRVRHSLTVPRLHSHFREHLAGRQPAFALDHVLVDNPAARRITIK